MLTSCGPAATGVEPLREKYINTGQVSYEFRDFLVHPQDLGVALLGRCVATEAFFPILDQMYVNQQAFNEKQAQVTEQMFQQIQAMNRNDAAGTWTQLLGYNDFMMQRGMPESQVKACLADAGATERLSKQLLEGQQRDELPRSEAGAGRLRHPQRRQLQPNVTRS